MVGARRERSPDLVEDRVEQLLPPLICTSSASRVVAATRYSYSRPAAVRAVQTIRIGRCTESCSSEGGAHSEAAADGEGEGDGSLSRVIEEVVPEGEHGSIDERESAEDPCEGGGAFAFAVGFARGDSSSASARR